MGKIIDKEDFVGFQEVVRSLTDDPNIDIYIARFEKEYIYKLLGVALGDLFWADIAANQEPQTQKYKDIFNAFTLQNGSSIVESKGIKDLLLSAVFYHYVTERSVLHTQAGAAHSNTESFALSDSVRFAERRFNDMLKSWDAIKYKISIDTGNNYPTFVYMKTPAPKYGSLL